MPRRVKCGGTEGEIVVAHGCRKTKNLICDTEGEIVVAHGNLPSPARTVGSTFFVHELVFGRPHNVKCLFNYFIIIGLICPRIDDDIKNIEIYIFYFEVREHF